AFADRALDAVEPRAEIVQPGRFALGLCELGGEVGKLDFEISKQLWIDDRAGGSRIVEPAGNVLKSGLQRAQGACAVWRVETPGDFLQSPLQIVEEAAPLLDGVLLTPLHKFCQMGESVFKTAEEMVCIRCRRNGVEPFGNARDVRGKPLHRLL